MENRLSGTPDTPKEALNEFASNCSRWEAQSREKMLAARNANQKRTAKYEEGMADGFKLPGMMAQIRADMLP